MPDESAPAPSKWRKALEVLKIIALAILGFIGVSLLFAAIGAGAYWGIQRLAFNSKPCQAAVAYVSEDKAVAKALGTVQACTLPWLADYSTDETLDGGQAHYVLHAVGAKATGTVDVQLEKLKRVWTVTHCTVTKDPEPVKVPAAPAAKKPAKGKAEAPKVKAKGAKH